MFGHRLSQELGATAPSDPLKENLISGTLELASTIANQPVMHMAAARSFMTVFFGLVEKIGTTTEGTATQYDTLPKSARDALRAATGATSQYLAASRVKVPSGDTPGDSIAQTRRILARMNQHMAQVQASEPERRAQAARLSIGTPDDLNDIRLLLLEYGDAFGPVVTGVLDTQPSENAHSILAETTARISGIRPWVGLPPTMDNNSLRPENLPSVS